MKEILRTNDIIRLNWAQNLLSEHNIEVFHLDKHMATLEGSISAIQQRLMVHDDDFNYANEILKNALKELEDSYNNDD